MDTNIINIKSVSVWWCFYVLSNTSATFEAQFMKKLSNTEAELKKALLIKKACNAKNSWNNCIGLGSLLCVEIFYAWRIMIYLLTWLSLVKGHGRTVAWDGTERNMNNFFWWQPVTIDLYWANLGEIPI